MFGYRYSGWDGSQALDLDADDILSALSDDLLERGDPRQALRRLMQRGIRGQNLMGLQQLLQRLKERRQQRLDQYNLGSVVDELQKALEEILQLEREGIQRRVSDARQRVQPQDHGENEEGSSGDGEDGSEGAENNSGDGASQKGQSLPMRGQRGAGGGSGQRGAGQPQAGASGEGDLDPEQAQRLLEFMERMAQEKQTFLEGLPKELGGALRNL